MALVPILHHLRVRTDTIVDTLIEDILGVNIPVLDPEIIVLNRTPIGATSDMLVSLSREWTFTNQPDADFNGSYTDQLLVPTTVGNPGKLKIGVETLDRSIIDSANGVATTLRIENAGPGAEVLASVLIRGKIETNIRNDGYTVIGMQSA